MTRLHATFAFLCAMGLVLHGTEATAFSTTHGEHYLVVGNGPVNDSTGQFTNVGVGHAVDVSNYELGANQKPVPSPSDPTLAGNVPPLPAGIAPVGVGIFGNGNIAVTHPAGEYTLSNVNVYADLGIHCASSVGSCDDGSSNSFFNPPGNPIPANGVTGTVDFGALFGELTDARTEIPALAPTGTLDTSGNGGKITSDTTIDLSPGLNVIDIVTGGNDFALENANLVIDGPPGAVAIFRVNGAANFKISNGNVLVGDGGVGLNSVLFVSFKNDNATHFDFSNTVLNGVAFWDLGTVGSEISVDNGQGCTQFVGDKVGLQNVRFGRCAFTAPVCPSGPGQDADGDGVGDACDNCPFAANPSQSDLGGLGAASPPDGIGDACQCGDVTGDGRVTLADAVVMQRSLLIPPTAVQTQPELCDVNGSGTCSISDAVILQRSLLVPPTATIRQECAPAK